MTASELAFFARNLDLRYRLDGASAIGTDAGGKQLDLFSNDSHWIQEMEKISKVQSKMIAENLDKIRAVKSAVKRPETAKKMGVDINDPDSVKAQIERLEVENKRIANPDGKILQEIRKRAGLSQIEKPIEITKLKKYNWEKLSFNEQFNSYKNGNYPSGKLFSLGKPSKILKDNGIHDNDIVATEGVIKKIINHGIDDKIIEKIPELINNPVGIFSYPKNSDVFDLLVEMYTNENKPIIASLEINKTRQGKGEIVDLLTMHPKENWGRIIDWAKKGRIKYWNTEKGLKLLQDTIPANWERYETELKPFLPIQSPKLTESQENNSEIKNENNVKFLLGDVSKKTIKKLANLDEATAIEAFKKAKDTALKNIELRAKEINKNNDELIKKFEDSRKEGDWEGDDDDGWHKRISFDGGNYSIDLFKPTKDGEESFIAGERIFLKSKVELPEIRFREMWFSIALQ